MRWAGRVGGIGSVLALWLLFGCSAASALVFSGPATGEFLDPSPSAPPAVSAYNTTPNCPLNASDAYFCELPVASQPPQDLSNPERYLNSAYWPAEKRPDVETYAINNYGYDYENCSAKLPHYCFLTDAEAEGYPVTHTPQVGDLWLLPGECYALGPGTPTPAGCTDNANDWYMGYVDQVYPDGSFTASGGGAYAATDSGIDEYWFSGSVDPYTEFIGFLPAGEYPPLPMVTGALSVASPDGSLAVATGSMSDSSGQTCTASQGYCSFVEPQGSAVTFTETPGAGSTFVGWVGPCSGTSPTCQVTIAEGSSSAPWLIAQFEPTQSASGSSPGGSGSGGSGGGHSGKGGGGSGTTKTPPSEPVRILSVSTRRGMIRVRLSRSSRRPACALFRREHHRWVRLRRARCGTSVTYGGLTAGRYRLTVVTPVSSVTRTIVLRAGRRPVMTPRHSGA